MIVIQYQDANKGKKKTMGQIDTTTVAEVKEAVKEELTEQSLTEELPEESEKESKENSEPEL